VSKFINNNFLRVSGLVILMGCYRSSIAFAQSDSTRLMNILEQLCGETANGRKPGTAGHQWANELIVNQFQEIGLEKIGEGYLQSAFSEDGKRILNIHGLIRGSSERYMLITAHYDHLGERDSEIYYGCDDDASGVASMLEIARYFKTNPTQHSLIFIAFDREEEGLLGSKYWAENPVIPLEKIDLIFNMDMVSKNDKNEIYASGAYHHSYLKSPIEEVGEGFKSLSVRFGHDRPMSGPDDWTYASDHGPFLRKGVPHIYFGVEDHPYYHKPTDTFERTSFSFYQNVTNFLISTVERLDKELPND